MADSSLSELDLQKLLHGLQVQQADLERQNHELCSAKHKLERSQVRYFEMYDLAPVGYLTTSEQGLILEANLTAASLIGVERAALVTQLFFDYIHPDDQDMCNMHRSLLLSTGTPQKCELRLLKKDGGYIWVTLEAVATHERETGENVVRVVMIDISERKQVEDDLRQALENAKGINATMNRLLRVVAHEFRSPLGVLTGSTDILDRYGDRLEPEKRFAMHEHIRNSARQLNNLVSSVLAFNRLGLASPGNPPRLLDIGKSCSAIAAEIDTVWSAGQEYSVTIAEGCGVAMLDETLLRRIVENLLVNAFRYTPSTGSVSYYVKRDMNRLCMEISDTGIGIPEEEQEMIFDAYYRCRNIEGRAGLGVGLSIVLDALKQMGGTITVDSRNGRGTTMRVNFPVADAE